MSLSAVPYNPYNTSFGEFAMKGLQMAQVNMEASERQAQQTAKSITDSFVFAADIMQKSADNKARDREGARLERADAFKEMAFGVEMDFKKERAVAEDGQFNRSHGLAERNAGQEDKRFGLAEKVHGLNERTQGLNEQWKVLEFGERANERAQNLNSPENALRFQQFKALQQENDARAAALQVPGAEAAWGESLLTGGGSRLADGNPFEGVIKGYEERAKNISSELKQINSIFGKMAAPIEDDPLSKSPERPGGKANTESKRRSPNSTGGDDDAQPPPEATQTKELRAVRAELMRELSQLRLINSLLADPATRDLEETRTLHRALREQLLEASKNQKLPAGGEADPEDSGWMYPGAHNGE